MNGRPLSVFGQSGISVSSRGTPAPRGLLPSLKWISHHRALTPLEGDLEMHMHKRPPSRGSASHRAGRRLPNPGALWGGGNGQALVMLLSGPKPSVLAWPQVDDHDWIRRTRDQAIWASRWCRMPLPYRGRRTKKPGRTLASDVAAVVDAPQERLQLRSGCHNKPMGRTSRLAPRHRPYCQVHGANAVRAAVKAMFSWPRAALRAWSRPPTSISRQTVLCF